MRDRVLFLILLFSLFPGRGTGEALNDAAAAQRQAIAELIQSLKSARRILSAGVPRPSNLPAAGDAPFGKPRRTAERPDRRAEAAARRDAPHSRQ